MKTKKRKAGKLSLPDREQQLGMLQKMHEIRFFEKAAGDLYQKGLTKGGIHTCVGQEAVAVGISAHLCREDMISSTHRGHGHHIAKGADINRLMAEIMGKANGYCRGRGGSMHVAAFDVGSLGAFPILASGLPVAVGAALSARLFGKDYIVVSYLGDGAMGQGTFFEAINMAKIWKLAVVFVCESNGYAVSTPTSEAISFQGLHRLADAYGIPCDTLNGQNVLEVYEFAGRAIARTRAGEGPCFIQANTYRFEGHYFGEPETYRTREEVQDTRKEKDPIQLFRSNLLNQKIADEGELTAIEEIAYQAVQEAKRFAEESAEPPSEEFAKYVYA